MRYRVFDHAPLYIGLVLVLTLAACAQGAKLQPTTGSEQSAVEKSFSLLTDVPIPPNATLGFNALWILGDLDRWTSRIILDVDRQPLDLCALSEPDVEFWVGADHERSGRGQRVVFHAR